MIKFLFSILVVFIFSSLAFAHVTIESNNLTAGGYAKLTFMVPHGCDGSATTKITVQIPEGTLSVKPQVHTGWSISTKEVKLKKPLTLHGKAVSETVSEVSWEGGPLLDKYMDEFAMSVRLPDQAGVTNFPVVQVCEKGILNWTEIKDQDSHFPAPSLTLNKKDKVEQHHHH